MGGGGFAQYANNVMKANRALVKKRKFKDIKKMVFEKTGKTEVEFKQVSPEKLARIKSEIRSKAKKSAQKDIFITICCTVIVIAFMYWFLFKY